MEVYVFGDTKVLFNMLQAISSLVGSGNTIDKLFYIGIILGTVFGLILWLVWKSLADFRA